MIELNFKNMESNELARQIVFERLDKIMKQMPRLAHHRFRISLERIDSGPAPVPDYFKITLDVKGIPFRHLNLCKQNPSLYQAISEVCEELTKRLT